MRRKPLLLVILMITMILSACSSETPKEEPNADNPPVNIEPVAGGKLLVGINGSGIQIDPLGYNPESAPVYTIEPLLYRGLFKYNEKLQLQPDLASTHSMINEEENKVEITLDNGLYFEDGKEITLDDVKTTLEWYSNRNFYGAWKNYTFNIVGTDLYREGKAEDVAGIKILPDENKLIIEYHNLTANDLQLLTAPIFPKSQFIDKTYSEIKETSLKGEFKASGPFKVESYNQSELVLIKNQSYKEETYLDGISFEKYEPTKEYDMIVALPQQVIEAKEDEQIVKLWGSGYQYLGMNLNHQELKNEQVRRAIAASLDYQGIIDRVYQGLADRPLSTIHPNSWAYSPIQVELNQLEGKELLTSKNLKLELAYENSESNELIAKEIVAQLSASGVTVTLKPVERESYKSTLFSKGSYDLFLASWPYDIDPVKENYKWLSKNDVLNGGYNVSHVKDEASDKLLNAGAEITDVVKRTGIYGDWQDHFMKKNYIVPIASPQNLFIIVPNVTVEMNNSLFPYSQIDNWWISPEQK